MKVRKEWIGSKKAATQGNLADVQEDIHLDLHEISQKMATKEDLKALATKEDLKKFATKEYLKGLMTKETGEELLNYIKAIVKQLKEWRDIPEAVKDLKNRVFKLEMRR